MDIRRLCLEHGIPLERLGPIGELSDGFHTFDSLYHQRLVLFAALANTFPTLAWKSRKHFDGEAPFGGGWFVVGIDTPKGQYTYHYEDKDWDIFHCKEVKAAPKWDGHTDADVERLLSLTEEESDWAGREVELASRKEREGTESEGTDNWDYGVACYESALRAYRSLCRDGHSGFSIQITKSILNRLIDGKCLTPIEDDPDIWTEVEGLGKTEKKYQCKRMSSLFKCVAPDGTVTYKDVNRAYGTSINSLGAGGFHNGLIDELVHKLYPITMPYLPSAKKYQVVCEDFLFDPKGGDYDTMALLYLMTPEGKRVDLNRYFKDGPDGKMVPIEKEEYEERKARKVK